MARRIVHHLLVGARAVRRGEVVRRYTASGQVQYLQVLRDAPARGRPRGLLYGETKLGVPSGALPADLLTHRRGRLSRDPGPGELVVAMAYGRGRALFNGTGRW